MGRRYREKLRLMTGGLYMDKEQCDICQGDVYDFVKIPLYLSDGDVEIMCEKCFEEFLTGPLNWRESVES